MRLRDLQRAFQARVLSFTPGIEPELNGATTSDFEPRLDTYVDGYRTRLVGALAATYPVLQMTMGDEEFAHQMCRYMDANPSRVYSVRAYGAQIDRQLVADHAGEVGARLGELARWEWTLAADFDAQDDQPLDPTALAAHVPEVWPALRFSLRASLRRFATSTNIVEWWRAANGLCEPPAALADAPTSQWLLWRRGMKTFFRSLDPLEAETVDAARAGANFGELCELIAQHVEESQAAHRAVALLQGWLAEELIAGCSVSTATE